MDHRKALIMCMIFAAKVNGIKEIIIICKLGIPSEYSGKNWVIRKGERRIAIIVIKIERNTTKIWSFFFKITLMC